MSVVVTQLHKWQQDKCRVILTVAWHIMCQLLAVIWQLLSVVRTAVVYGQEDRAESVADFDIAVLLI